jgi:hypothetical protein
MKMIETVNILDWKYGYFPRRFLWRGRLFEVTQVDRVESKRREWPRRQQSRHYWLRTGAGEFVLRHDLSHDMWHVLKAPAEAPEMERATAGEHVHHKGGVANGYRLVVVR